MVSSLILGLETNLRDWKFLSSSTNLGDWENSTLKQATITASHILSFSSSINNPTIVSYTVSATENIEK